MMNPSLLLQYHHPQSRKHFQKSAFKQIYFSKLLPFFLFYVLQIVKIEFPLEKIGRVILYYLNYGKMSKTNHIHITPMHAKSLK